MMIKLAMDHEDGIITELIGHYVTGHINARSRRFKFLIRNGLVDYASNPEEIPEVVKLLKRRYIKSATKHISNRKINTWKKLLHYYSPIYIVNEKGKEFRKFFDEFNDFLPLASEAMEIRENMTLQAINKMQNRFSQLFS